MKLETYNCKIPTWAMNYLFNAETEGLTPDDLETVRKWEASWDAPISISPGKGEPYFSNSPAFGPPCDVMDCEVLVRKEE